MNLDSTTTSRAIGLLSTFQKDTGASTVDADGQNLIAWLNLKSKQRGMSLVTAKCYRRWLAAYLESLEHPSAIVVRNWAPPDSKEHAIAVDGFENHKSHAIDVRSTHSDTNSRYYAYIEEDSFKALLEQLVDGTKSSERPRYKCGEEIALFLVVSAMTGVRPMEWLGARLHETYFDYDTKLTLGPVLEVETLKQSRRREDNPLKAKRYLVLDEWPEAQLNRLRVMLDVVAEILADEGEPGFKRYLKRNRQQLRRAWDRLAAARGIDQGNLDKSIVEPDDPEAPSKWVTFYTARHIFAEEIRRSRLFTRFELAAMMGHSLLSNQAYYGPRDKTLPRGFDFVLPRPWPGDAEDLKQWNYTVNPFRFQSMQRDMFAGDSVGLEEYEREQGGMNDPAMTTSR